MAIEVLYGQNLHFDATFGKNVANRAQAIEKARGHGYNDIQENGNGNHSSFHRRFFWFGTEQAPDRKCFFGYK